MALVAISRDGSVLAADAVTAGRRVRLRSAPATSLSRSGAAVLGLPLATVGLKELSLPPLAAADLREAIRLQASFHLPGVAPTGVRSQVTSSERGHRVLLIASPPGLAVKAGAVFPEPLALVGLALLCDALDKGQNTLLVGLDRKRALTVMLAGTEVVLMRDVPLPSWSPTDATWIADTARDLRLACQAVYLREERRPLRPDRTVVFAPATPELAAALAPERFGDVRWVTPDECVDAADAEAEPEGAMLLAGLEVLRRYRRRFRPWDLRTGTRHLAAALRRGLLWSVPLWPLALVLYYEGESRLNLARLAALDGRLHALAPRYRELDSLTAEVTALSSLTATADVGIESPRRWHDILTTLEAARPPGVSLTVFSGRLGGLLLASGRSPDYDRVTSYVAALSACACLSDVVLVLSESRGDGVDFQLSFRLRADPVVSPQTATPSVEEK